MLNFPLLRAWPNYLIIPIMLIMWVVVGVLAAELIGADSFTTEG